MTRWVLYWLNDIIVSTGFLGNSKKYENAYCNRCFQEFSNPDYDNYEMVQNAINNFNYGFIKFRKEAFEDEITVDFKDLSKIEILTKLKEGKLIITQYGRAWLDTNSREQTLIPWKDMLNRIEITEKEVNKSKNEVDILKDNIDKTEKEVNKSKDEISELKNNMYVQILTLMGIIVTVITLINVSIDLFKDSTFVNACLCQQIQAILVICIPICITIFVLLILSYIGCRLLNNINWKRKN